MSVAADTGSLDTMKDLLNLAAKAANKACQYAIQGNTTSSGGIVFADNSTTVDSPMTIAERVVDLNDHMMQVLGGAANTSEMTRSSRAQNAAVVEQVTSLKLDLHHV